MLPSQQTQVRFFKFLSVGGFAFVVQFITLWLFKSRMPADLAFTLSFICSTSTHYTMNRFWALPSSRADSWKQFTEYLITSGISYVINISLFKLCHNLLGLNEMWSAAIALPPSTLVVFLILNYRVFRHKHHPTQPSSK